MKQLLLLFFSLITLNLLADNVSLEESRSVATKFWASLEPQNRSLNDTEFVLAGNSESLQVLTENAPAPAFYIFNCVEKGGFVIVSGEDTAQPILAYSTTDKFAIDNMPDNIRNWLQAYRTAIQQLRLVDVPLDENTVNLWKSPERTLTQANNSKLIETAKWNQEEPYNLYSPKIVGRRTPTGCVATAMAIIMRYRQWPDIGEGSNRYYANTCEKYLETSFDVNYDWEGMPLEYIEGKYTKEEADKVSMLMYHCGIAAEMDYGLEGSGAVTRTAILNMIKYFKYDKSAYILQRDWYDQETWDNLIRNEVTNESPVMYGGADPDGAHQFIIDGYEGSHFHVNWGWGGLCNGFYLLSALTPEQQGVGGNGSYNQLQDAVMGLKKREENSTYHDILIFFAGLDNGKKYNGLSTNTSTYVTGKTFRMDAAYIGNSSLRDFEGSLVLALVNKNGEVKENISKTILLEETLPLGMGIGYPNIECKITQAIEAGDRIWMMYKSKDASEWYRIVGEKGTVTEIIVKEDDPTAIEQPVDRISFSASCDKQGWLTANLPEGVQRLCIYSVDGRTLRTYIPDSNIEKWGVSCSELPAGIYILQAVTKQENYQCKFVK